MWEYLQRKQIWYIVDPNINREINLCNFASSSQQRSVDFTEKDWDTYILCLSRILRCLCIWDSIQKKGKSVKAFALNFPKINQIARQEYSLHINNITIRKTFVMVSTFKWLPFLRCNSQSLRTRFPFYSTSGSYCVQSIYSKWHNRKHWSSWESNFLGSAAIR